MAFGDLVKSVIVRFSTEHFEEVKAELADIPDSKDVTVKLDMDRSSLSRLQRLLGGGGGAGDILGALGGGSFGGTGGIIGTILANPENLSALAGGLVTGALGGILIAQLLTVLPAIAAAVVGTAGFAALAYPTVSAVIAAISAGSAAGLNPAEVKLFKGVQGIETDFGKMATALQPVVDQLGAIALTIAQKLLPTLLPFAQAAGKALIPLAESLSKFTSSAGFHQFVNDMLRLSGPSITAIGEGIGKVAVAIGKLLEDLSKPNSVRVLSDIFNAIVVIINIIGQWTTGTLQNTTRMVGYIETLGASFKQLGKDILQWQLDATHDVDAFLGLIGRIPGDIATALSPGSLFKIGQDAITGLIHGLESIPVIGTAIKIGSDIVGALKNATGSHSPSVLTFAIGADVSRGLEGGLVSRLGSVTAAATTMARAAIPGAGVYGSAAGAGGLNVTLTVQPAAFRSWFKADIRAHGGNPNVIGS